MRLLRGAGARSAVVLTIAGLTCCLAGAGRIALALPGAALAAAGAVLLVAGLGALVTLAPGLAGTVISVAGAALTAEGIAVGWLGHMGGLELVLGVPLLAGGILLARRRGAGARRRGRTPALLGGTAVLAVLLGVGGLAVTALPATDGDDCLTGYAGDPTTHPDAPADATAIRSGFAWWPIGRACSWEGGLPAVSADRTTVSTTQAQGDTATSSWIAGLAAGGAVLLAAAGLLRGRRRRTAA